MLRGARRLKACWGLGIALVEHAANESHVGTHIIKSFDGFTHPFRGVVKRIAIAEFEHLVFEDGDCDDIDAFELQAVAILDQRTSIIVP